MPNKALITGSLGFVGGFLVAELRGKGYEVCGLSREEGGLSPQVNYPVFRADLLDEKSVNQIIKTEQPDFIFHLAALSSVAHSWKAPQEVLRVNIESTVNLLQAVKQYLPTAKVLLVGSAEAYGEVLPEQNPILETLPLRPTNFYALSKMACDLLGFQYWHNFGLHVVRVRPFNHTGPGRPPHFVEADFASQVALIEKEKQPPVIKVGNLEAVRDFSDVRDIVKGYESLLQKGKAGEVYNIGSGKGIKISAVLDKLLELSGAQIEVQQDPQRMRPSDLPVSIASISKIQSEIGYSPQYDFLEDTLPAILDDYRLKSV